MHNSSDNISGLISVEWLMSDQQGKPFLREEIYLIEINK